MEHFSRLHAFVKKHHRSVLVALIAVPWSIPVAFVYMDDSVMGPGELICVTKNKLSDDTHNYVWVNGEDEMEKEHHCEDKEA